MILLTFFAFLSGIITILSPCILPVLPIVLSGSIGGKRKPLGVVTGFLVSFSIFTLVLSTLVRILQIPPDSLRIAAVVIIVGFGLVLLIPRLQQWYEAAVSKISRNRGGGNNNGFSGGLLLGASLGLLWTPCVGPIMASVISLAISQRIDGGAVIIILAYSLGTAIPMFGVMMGGRQLLQRFPKLTAATGKIQRGFGIVMIILGISMGLGFDRKFQSAVLTAFPNYGSGLTALEHLDPVQEALDNRSGTDGEPKELTWESTPEKGILENFGPAPELITGSTWFNTEGLPFDPEENLLTMDDLKGKVVLIDFWTYSCVNCVRTLPYLRSWYETYSDQGLIIIGVHSPEFAFERNENNLRKAIKELGVTWPVMQDNNFQQWQRYNNRYWPAHYFIDAEGQVRYYHFGEGEYDTAEKVIRKLLKEAGNKVRETAERIDRENLESRTPETYLGYGRTTGFLPQNGIKTEEAADYTLSDVTGNGDWSIEGRWIFRKNFIESAEPGVLEIRFNAKDLFLVIEPIQNETSITVILDGEYRSSTPDVNSGILVPDESRLYQLVDLEKAGEHTLRLEVDGPVRLYAFTFG